MLHTEEAQHSIQGTHPTHVTSAGCAQSNSSICVHSTCCFIQHTSKVKSSSYVAGAMMKWSIAAHTEGMKQPASQRTIPGFLNVHSIALRALPWITTTGVEWEHSRSYHWHLHVNACHRSQVQAELAACAGKAWLAYCLAPDKDWQVW